MGPGQGRGAWLYGWGRSNPQEWLGGREQVDSGPGNVWAYQGLCRQLWGPGLLCPGQVPLGCSSLDAAGAPPGPTGHRPGTCGAGQRGQ